jgi:CubicO group peptidase (beta-lactamase class C family)
VSSAESLRRVRDLAGQVGATAVVVRDHDRELMSVGEPSATVHCRSIRKPLLGALLGRHVVDGTIDLDASLADLGIGDRVPPPLTAGERAARVRDLLTCRSGVYHPANHQPASAILPGRGAHRPGTHFVYNNWDFNALGTILERRIGKSMFDEFADTIAGPAGMQDFDRAQQRYATEPWSEHRTYAFHMSARDLARFGALYLPGAQNAAQHAGRAVIPPEWIAVSTRAHTKTRYGPDFGYLWWIASGGRLFAGTNVPAGSFAAYGTGSQFLLVIPALNRVIALLADPRRPAGTDRTAHRPKLAELLHHATAGAVTLAPGPDPIAPEDAALTSGPY